MYFNNREVIMSSLITSKSTTEKKVLQMFKKWPWLLVATIMLFLSACGDDGSSNPVVSTGDSSSAISQNPATNPSSSGITLPVSSSVVTSSSSQQPVSSGTSDNVELYLPGFGGQVSTGGYFYGDGQTGDGARNTFTCGSTSYEGGDDQPAEWTSCESADGLTIGFDVSTGEDGDGAVWGYGLVGFDFEEQVAGTSDANKTPYDITSYGGICVEYMSDATFKALLKTTGDQAGDAYGVNLLPSSTFTKKDVAFAGSDFSKAAWSGEWLFDPTLATGVQFKVEKAGESSITLKSISLGSCQ